MTDEQKLAFDFARTVTLQLITVATAMVTLGVTFFEKFKPAAGTNAPTGWLIVSWIAFGASVLAGFWSWLAQTGTLADPGPLGLTIKRTNIQIPCGVQIVLFAVGLISTVVYGVAVLP